MGASPAQHSIASQQQQQPPQPQQSQPTRSSAVAAEQPSHAPPPQVGAAAEQGSTKEALHLTGASTGGIGLFILRVLVNGVAARALLDSGASSNFISPAFARSSRVSLVASDRKITLADGSLTAAEGAGKAVCGLETATGAPIRFHADFTATPLGEAYDVILGMTWLAKHNPVVGWSERTLQFRTTDGLRTVKPIEKRSAHVQLASISLRSMARAWRKGQIRHMAVIRVVHDEEDAPPAEPEPLHPRAAKIVADYADVFGEPPPGVTTRDVKHQIKLVPGATPPPVRPLRHQSERDIQAMNEYIEKLTKLGQIRVSNSPFGSRALVVYKKDGTPRIVVDYRALNDITVKDRYPLPLMDELFDRVHGAKVFSSLDLVNGFHQIAMDEADIEKTAFRTRYGSYEYTVLPMGLCNAPSTFMRLMNESFRDMIDKWLVAFLDDLLVYSGDEESHDRQLRATLDRMRERKLYVKLKKCEFFKREVGFLGHKIGADGLSVATDKVEAVREWPVPRNITDVRAFLGLAGFYRRFIKDFAHIALPLTNLTRTTQKWAWTDEAQAAFERLKGALSAAPVLATPDPSKPYTLSCDACHYAIGAALQQDHGNGLQPVAYMSGKLDDAAINYDTREKEFMALLLACEKWRQYLHGRRFTLLSDHDSLKYFRTMPNLSGRLARWIERLAGFDFDLQHIAGAKNVVADALSRRADLRPDEPHSLAMARVKLGRPAAERKEEEERARFKREAETTHPPHPDRPAPKANGTIQMPSQRCTGSTRTGAHCRQRTAKGQYCWNHLQSVHGLRIKRSGIAGAGLGLFAARPLAANYRIDYTGDEVPLRDASDGGVYFLQFRRNMAVDAARTNTAEGRWVNDPRGSGASANAEFTLFTPPGGQRRGQLKLTRDVAAGEEILVSYGDEYWRFHLKAKGKRRAPRQGRIAPAEALAAVTQDGGEEGSLASEARRAATQDAAYSERLANPQPGDTIKEGLVWRDGRLVVPADAALRTRILALCHDAVPAAHFGRDKVLASAKARFEWQGLATDVDQYVRTCDACQRNKPSQQATPGLLMPLPIPERPCREWTQDAVTGLPRTARGNDAIQVYVERLCKLKHFAASQSTATASDLARSLVHTVIRPHGVPESIVSDRDPRFTAHFYEELSRLLGVQLRMSTSRHPQSDGQSEREIRTLVTALRAFCNEHQDDWDEYLDMLELGFNSAVQASTGRSPHELLYGEAPRLPVDALIGAAPKTPAAIDRAQRMKDAVHWARDHLLSAQERQAAAADRHRRDDEFKVGEGVLLSTEGLRLTSFNNKLCSPWVGPFEVAAVVNRNAYRLLLPQQMQALHPTFNIDKLKRYRESPTRFASRQQQYARPPAAEADSNGDELWEVDRILASRRKGRATEYLVAWKGYRLEEATWEPAAHLANARGAMRDFQQMQRGAPMQRLAGIEADDEAPAPRLVGIELNPGPCNCGSRPGGRIACCRASSACSCQRAGVQCAAGCGCQTFLGMPPSSRRPRLVCASQRRGTGADSRRGECNRRVILFRFTSVLLHPALYPRSSAAFYSRTAAACVIPA